MSNENQAKVAADEKFEVTKDRVELHLAAAKRAWISTLVSTITAIASATGSAVSLYHVRPNFWVLIAAGAVLLGLMAVGTALVKREQSKLAILKSDITAAYLRHLRATKLNPAPVGSHHHA